MSAKLGKEKKVGFNIDLILVSWIKGKSWP